MVLKLFKLFYINSVRRDLDLSKNDNFFNLVNFISKKKLQPNEKIFFDDECMNFFEKQTLIKNNKQEHKNLDAMEIFIKIYNSLKNIVNSWESDQQVKKSLIFFSQNNLDKIFDQKIQVASKLLL